MTNEERREYNDHQNLVFQMKQADRNPQKYNECTNCTHLFSKMRAGNNWTREVSDCPKCGSLNFKQYFRKEITAL